MMQLTHQILHIIGNCESFIAQNLIATARPRGPIFGYSDSRGLLLAGPYDLTSNSANQSFDTTNGETALPPKFLLPNEMIDYTRHGHNEFSMERLIFDQQTNAFRKRMPSYVIWIEERKTEGMTEEEIKEKRESDERWKLTKKAASQLGIPIVVINREYFAEREQDRVREMQAKLMGEKELEEGERPEQLIKQLIVNFENNATGLKYADPRVQEEYFTNEQRIENIKIIEKSLEAIKEESPEEYRRCLETFVGTLKEEVRKYEYVREEPPQAITEVLERYKDIEVGKQVALKNIDTKMNISSIIEDINRQGFYNGNEQHSVEHIEKVVMFSALLEEQEKLSPEETKMLLTAAAFHDSGRAGIDGNEEHAEASAEFFGKYFDEHSGFYGINSQEQANIIKVIIEYHEYVEEKKGEIDTNQINELMKKHGLEEQMSNPHSMETIYHLCAILKDADALDRYRFAERGKIDQSYLRTGSARRTEMLEYAYSTNKRYAEQILKETYGMSREELKGRDPIEVLREKRTKSKRPNKEISLSKKQQMLGIDTFDPTLTPDVAARVSEASDTFDQQLRSDLTREEQQI